MPRHLYHNNRAPDRKRYFGFTIAAALGTTLGMTTAAGALTTTGVVTGTVLTAGMAVGGMYAMKGMMGSGKQPSMSMPSAPDPEVAKQQAEREQKLRSRAQARNKSIFTSPLGLSEEEKQTKPKVLLGA